MTRRLALAALLALLGVPVLATGASAAAFSNTTPVVVPLPERPEGCPPACPSEKAAPYPSTIAVSGVSGRVTDVNVTLRDLTYEHNGPADADILLVAPGGKAVMVMSDACGDNDNPYPISAPITLTFDDQAGTTLPGDAACTAGTYRPLDDDDDGEFPFHEPDGITGGPAAPAGTQPLSTFNGIEANGTWSLYVVDDYPNEPNPTGRAGQLGGGWSIDVVTSAGAGGGAAAQATTTTTAAARPRAAATTATTVASTTSTTRAPAGPPLADTGFGNGQLIALAGALMATGWVMVRLSRQKNRACYIEVRWH